MAIPSRSSSGQTVASGTNYPEKIEPLPADLTARFTSLQAWQSAFDRWWYEFRSVLQRERDQLSAAVNTDAIALASYQVRTDAVLSSLQNELNDLAAQLTALAGNTDLDGLETDITALQSLVQAHIAAVQAHGTTSPIVGTTDEQTLEKKSIGLVHPRYGRFTSLMSRQSIAGGETVVIPVGYSAVIAGPFQVNGTLSVEGTLLVL